MTRQYSKYVKMPTANGWIICEKGHDYLKPSKACTFAIDTETQVYFKGRILSQKSLFKKLQKLSTEERRKALSNVTWAWQCYDELNGFFMTNDFYEWLAYHCRCSYKFGWCYNATFDFAQIDYELLATGKDKWTPHMHEKRGSGKGYNKGQPWTYESVHSDMGARYAYKLWIPYKNKDRHEYVHAVEFRDFAKFVPGGLAKLLKDLKVKDNDGNDVRKLTMSYQAVDTNNLKEADIDYCANDVKGLYFAIKKFNGSIEEQSNGECHIFGKDTNLMTAGGFAKRELLRSMYPNLNDYRKRIKQYQKEHPLTVEQDKFVRDNHLYRGGIVLINPRYKGKMLTKAMMKSPMYRYDVNSEYPYAMSIANDLIGQPIKKPLEEWLSMSDEERSQYEAVYVLMGAYGTVKKGCIGVWYDPFEMRYVDEINESGMHLMFERELNEMSQWYDDFEIDCKTVLLWKKGERVYAPFVNKNYAIKAQAKKDGNPTLQLATKLEINNAYGKLAERSERITGHYELSDDTGAIHFVRDDTEVDAKSMMNVVVGSLITAIARCYILSKIREMCGNRITYLFVYIDTDSIHAFAKYDKADAFTLGGLKLEAVCDAIKYIAPKTYIDILTVQKDDTVNMEVKKDGTVHCDFEIHSKGINVNAVILDLMKKQKGKRHKMPTVELLDRKIAYGAKYICLIAMNVKGGKVLVPTEKYIARWELAPNGQLYAYNNIDGGMINEL